MLHIHKHLRFLLLSAAAAFVLSAPSMAEDATPVADKPLLYGIFVGAKSDFWATVEKGAADAADKLGYRIVYRGAAQTDVNSQKELVDIAIKEGAKGIFMAPNSPERAADVATAKAAGVPVVYFDRKMGDAEITSFIGTNNYAGGELAAQKLMEKIGADKTAKVVVFRMDEKVDPVSQREVGFMDASKQAGYEVVASPFVTSEIGEARSRIYTFLTDPASPAFDAIFTSSEYGAVATLLALQMAGKTDDYIHIGFDAGPAVEKAIRDGDLYGTIVQQPYEMGYKSIEALDATLKGQQTEPLIQTDVLFVNKDNVDTYNKQ